MTRILLLLLALNLPVVAQPSGGSAAKKAEALLATMTLDEKIGQMAQVDYWAIRENKNDIATYGLGSLLWGGSSDPSNNSPQEWAAVVDSFQVQAQKTRLKIPLLLGVDAVHGHNNVDGAVVFPHNIALGASHNPKLVEQVAKVTAAEMQATGIQWDFAPCVAVARNERWGRTYESFGEDPALVKELGAAYVRGMQGSSLADPLSALACVKHFVGDGGTTNGKDQGNDEIDEATLRLIHLPGYVEAIKAGARSIMISYNSWNGKKMHGNKYLMTDVLKKELKFNGFLVSDWAAINQLPGSYKDQIEQSINAGLDMVMLTVGPSQKTGYVEFIRLLKELVMAGKVPAARVDDAVLRILTVKYEMDLFSKPFRDKNLLATLGSQEHRDVGRDAVRQSLVLLKNDKQMLPLSKTAARIHVAGKGADNLGMQCGGWTLSWQGDTVTPISGGTTILTAIRKTVSPQTAVTYSVDGSGAAGADAGVVVIGEQPYAEMMGDREDLSLSKEDLAVIGRMKAAGIPVAVLLLSGRPMIIDQALTASNAFLAVWLPGTEGQGVADVLFGDFKPVGKIPHSWPRSMQQVPINIGDTPYDPLFPFGFGLSYGK